VIIYIGLDDFDSRQIGCTTHLAYILIKGLNNLGCKVIGYPALIRLNPDVPWKTRGNGAVSIKVRIHKSKFDTVISYIYNTCKGYYALEENTNPGVVILRGEYIPKHFSNLYISTLTRLVSLSEVLSLLNKFKKRVLYWAFGSGQGLVGATAAIGARRLLKDYTYELLVYRPLNVRYEERRVSVLNLDEAWSKTFANIDYETGRLLITPHGLDPVILGLRGESPSLLKKVYVNCIKVDEDVVGMIIFITNQGTFANYMFTASDKCVATIDLYTQVCISGVIKDINVIEGGHMNIKVEDHSSVIDVMIYEPSGRIKEFTSVLHKGDEITVYGGVKPKMKRYTVNTQMIYLKRSYWHTAESTPICPKCGVSMASDGRGKGFKCKKCGYRIRIDLKLRIGINIYSPEVLLPPLRSIRHLTKPLKRIGREKS